MISIQNLAVKFGNSQVLSNINIDQLIPVLIDMVSDEM